MPSHAGRTCPVWDFSWSQVCRFFKHACVALHFVKVNWHAFRRGMAQDMLDRIRANREQAADYALTLGGEVDGSGLPATDQAEWVADVSTMLPGGVGGIEIDNRRISVTVRWEDATSPNDIRQVQLASEL